VTSGWIAASARARPTRRSRDAICRVAEAERARSGVAVAGLTGGVFQNRRLLELAAEGLVRRGFRVLLPERIPCNDGGLSYGQVAEHLGRMATAGH
jgi:hydrogenase maturation factor HypF (carbamoyltransferase family)